jgi:adenylate cyclase
VSFPKIVSARIGDAVRARWEWRRLRQLAGPFDITEHPSATPNYAVATNTARMKAYEIVACLNQLFSEFDKLAEDVGIEKIKTIGDNYMAVAGVPTPRSNHARLAAKFGLDMVAATGRLRSRLPAPFTIRVGLHSGPVMAGVIGTRKFAYDVWGDTVNIAARLEAASQPNRVLASAATLKGLGGDYNFDGPHKIDNKEGRVLEAFFVGRHP